MTCRICSAPESRAEWAIEGNSESEIGLCQCEKRCIWEGNKPMTIRPPGQGFCQAACQVACDAIPQAELKLGEHGSQKCAEFGRRVNYPSTKDQIETDCDLTETN